MQDLPTLQLPQQSNCLYEFNCNENSQERIGWMQLNLSLETPYILIDHVQVDGNEIMTYFNLLFCGCRTGMCACRNLTGLIEVSYTWSLFLKR